MQEHLEGFTVPSLHPSYLSFPDYKVGTIFGDAVGDSKEFTQKFSIPGTQAGPLSSLGRDCKEGWQEGVATKHKGWDLARRDKGLA